MAAFLSCADLLAIGTGVLTTGRTTLVTIVDATLTAPDVEDALTGLDWPEEDRGRQAPPSASRRSPSPPSITRFLFMEVSEECLEEG